MTGPWHERTARLVVAAAAAAVLLLGCAATSTPRPSSAPDASGSPAPAATDASTAATLPLYDAVGVALGIYSGRLDPAWTLTDAQAAGLRRIVDDLPTATIEPASGGLGYHGFTVTLGGSGAEPRTLVAYHGEIAEPGTGRRPAWLDPSGSVERFLLATGGSALSSEVVDAVTADLDGYFGGPASPSP